MQFVILISHYFFEEFVARNLTSLFKGYRSLDWESASAYGLVGNMINFHGTSLNSFNIIAEFNNIIVIFCRL